MISFDGHPQWPAVKAACQRLAAAGHLAYLAGGCVRDALMKRAPNDFDIATDADPDQVSALFPGSLPVGKAFGVVIIPHDGFQLEIATFRKDGEYVDGRRPESVSFCGPEDDAKRRDFTVNALFYDVVAGKVLDFVDGERDIRAALIRAVGAPDARFNEDKLRLLRAVRFAAQLGFAIEAGTWEAVRRRAPEATVVSAERAQAELTKLLKAPGRAEGARLLEESGLLKAFLPEIADALAASPQAKPLWLQALALMEPQESLAALWATFLFPATGAAGDRAPREAKRILARLKGSGELMDDVAWILGGQETLRLQGDLRVADVVILLADPRAHAAERVQLALAAASGDGTRAEETLRKRTALRVRFLEGGTKLPKPFLDGDDLKALGAKPSKAFGEILKEAFRLQIEKRLESRQAALEWAKDQLAD